MESIENTQENKMGAMPVNRLLISMSLPMMISMLVQALYNIIDSIFVSRINENALTAVSLAFPLQSLMIAFGVGTGVGINALLSRALGEKDSEKVNKAAVNGIFLDGVNFVIFLLIGLFAATPFYLSQTGDAGADQYYPGSDFYIRIFRPSGHGGGGGGHCHGDRTNRCRYCGRGGQSEKEYGDKAAIQRISA